MAENPLEAVATDNRPEPGRKLRSKLSETNVGDGPVFSASGTTAPEGHILGPSNRLNNSSSWPYTAGGRLRSTAFLIPSDSQKPGNHIRRSRPTDLRSGSKRGSDSVAVKQCL